MKTYLEYQFLPILLALMITRYCHAAESGQKILQFSGLPSNKNLSAVSLARISAMTSKTEVESVTVCLDFKLGYRVKMRIFESLNEKGERAIGSSVNQYGGYGFQHVKVSEGIVQLARLVF